MAESDCQFLKTGWFLLIVINFLFGICGSVICILKLKHGNQNVEEGFFKISIIFATCNLILSVLLLVSVIKNNQKYAFICALFSFLSLFSAIVHIESNTSANMTFLIIFSAVGVLFFFWFCVYAAYQMLFLQNKSNNENMLIYMNNAY